jgi:hypothetical protein
MNFLPNIFRSKDTGTLVIGEETAVASARASASQWFYFGSLGFLFLALLFSYFFTGNLLLEREVKTRSLFQTREQRNLEEKNLEALKSLVNNQEGIVAQAKQVLEAIPKNASSDQIVALLEYHLNLLKKKYFVELPESISWELVNESEISNPDLQGLSVTEYRFSFFGQYEAFLNLLTALRKSSRIIDVRSIRNLQEKSSGIVTADVSFLAYNLPTF